MTCCILILLYIKVEVSYDQNHKNSDRIYRIIRETRSGASNKTFSERTDGALASVLRKDYPEVQNVVRIARNDVWVQYNDKILNQMFCIADESIFDVFTFPLLRGDPRTVLKEPYSVAITQELAQKFFGEADPVGKIITIEGVFGIGDFKIAGVLEDIPQNSTLRFDVLTSTLPSSTVHWHWSIWQPTGWRIIENYVLLPEKYPHVELQRKLSGVIERYMGKEIAANNQYHIQPFNRIYLYSNLDYGIKKSEGNGPVYGDVTYLYASFIVASFSHCRLITFLFCVSLFVGRWCNSIAV
jgi:putative ABC transport system permease protein